MTISGTKIENLTAIYVMALGLERWFPNNNSAFAYGTRLCEETGELIEALQAVNNNGLTIETKHHLVKEIEDVLQIIMGILGIYNLINRFPKDITECMPDKRIHKLLKDDIIAISISAGQFADSINHMENQGIKKQKYDINPDERLLKKAHAFVEKISLFLQYYNLLSELETQITKDYLFLAEKGFINLDTE